MTSARGQGERVGNSWSPNIDGRNLKPEVWDHSGQVADRWGRGGEEGTGLLILDADVIFGRPLTHIINPYLLPVAVFSVILSLVSLVPFKIKTTVLISEYEPRLLISWKRSDWLSFQNWAHFLKWSSRAPFQKMSWQNELVFCPQN